MSRVRVAIGAPWYNGPDRDCAAQFLAFFHYLGRLQERLMWLNQAQRQFLQVDTLPPIDPHHKDPLAEVPSELIGTEFEFSLIPIMGCSLVGMARERIVDAALEWGASYLLFWDDDMWFEPSAFLRLYLDQKPVVAALAFTARDPATPVIYDFKESFEEDPEHPGEGRRRIDIAPVLDYQPNALQEVSAVGSGMILIKTDVFRTVPKPWFYSTGMGEDIWFSMACQRHGIPIYVDTRVKTGHKKTYSGWQTEPEYLAMRAKQKEAVLA